MNQGLVRYLKLGFKKSQNSARNDAPNAAAINAQHGYFLAFGDGISNHDFV